MSGNYFLSSLLPFGALSKLQKLDVSLCRALATLDGINSCTDLRTLNLKMCDQIWPGLYQRPHQLGGPQPE